MSELFDPRWGEAARIRLDAVAKTLRYAAELAGCADHQVAEGLIEAAADVEQCLTHRERLTGMACPVCEELTCDGGCPLASMRGEEES
jgi:hypothetical protein